MAISQVVAAKADGNLYNTVPPNVTGSGAGGNGGSVAKASNSSLLDGVETSYYNAGVFGSTVLDNNTSDKALSAGIFAYNNSNPISKRVTTTLSTTSNDVLLSGASQPELIQSIHKIETVRTRKLTTAIRENRYNEFTGQFEAGYPQVAVDSFNSDSAANPSRTNPGKLTYKTSSASPVNDSYKEKTG